MIFWQRFCQFILPYDGILIRREALKTDSVFNCYCKIHLFGDILSWLPVRRALADSWFSIAPFYPTAPLHNHIDLPSMLPTRESEVNYQHKNEKKRIEKKEYFINILVSSLCDFPWIKIWFAQRKENQKLQFQFHIMTNNSRYFHLLYRRIRFVMILYSNRNM